MAEDHAQMEFDMLGMPPLRLFIEPRGMSWKRWTWLRAMLQPGLICSDGITDNTYAIWKRLTPCLRYSAVSLFATREA